MLGAQPFAQGPGDIAVFAVIYEVIQKLHHMLLVGRFYGTQEELGALGTSCILNTFCTCTGDTVGIAHTSIEDAPASDATIYRLHSALRLHELGSAIATLTALDAIYVKRLDVPSWARFLQILEDGWWLCSMDLLCLSVGP